MMKRGITSILKSNTESWSKSCAITLLISKYKNENTKSLIREVIVEADRKNINNELKKNEKDKSHLE